ncbi:MAG TPA: hypothetical protein VJ761_15245, partial [Ktedonobacteraceae bacterium]|nr:hypothetical protein [Ktedonobacteraceae bacterium]
QWQQFRDQRFERTILFLQSRDFFWCHGSTVSGFLSFCKLLGLLSSYFGEHVNHSNYFWSRSKDSSDLLFSLLLCSPFELCSYSNFRMVGDEVALTAANPKLDVKVSLHPAFQCMVIGY